MGLDDHIRIMDDGTILAIEDGMVVSAVKRADDLEARWLAYKQQHVVETVSLDLFQYMGTWV